MWHLDRWGPCAVGSGWIGNLAGVDVQRANFVAVRNGNMRIKSPVLRRLEAESIYILREVAGQFRRPVLLYSIGKDSSVLVHLAKKAFYPARPPFPVLHVDTTWKFRDMIAFRDEVLP